MPNPKLETYKNKATNTVYDLTDANAQSQLTAIKDGTTIDSFGDVETALADYFPRSEQVIVGAYNLCIPTSSSTGIITRNADNTFTVNGTLAEATVYELGRDCFPTLQIGKTYKLVGCPSSGMPNGTNLSIRPVSTSTGGKTENGSGVTWEVTDATTASAFSYLYLAAGTYDNVVFKPMLTPDLNATYDDFVKGAMTNKELTAASRHIQSVNLGNRSTCKIVPTDFTNQQIFLIALSGSAPVMNGLFLVSVYLNKTAMITEISPTSGSTVVVNSDGELEITTGAAVYRRIMVVSSADFSIV